MDCTVHFLLRAHTLFRPPMNMIEQFGPYQLTERIATGGMAEIFKAIAHGSGGFQKVLAIKRL